MIQLKILILYYLLTYNLKKLFSFSPHYLPSIVYLLKSTPSSTMLRSSSNPITFLGKSSNNPLQPGTIITSPLYESSHWLKKCSIFLYSITKHYEFVLKGVILDYPTAFTIGEMSNSIPGVLSGNILLNGGDVGSDKVIVLHPYDTKYIMQDNKLYDNDSTVCKGSYRIGDSNIYMGGLHDLTILAEKKLIDSEKCQFVFNYVEFTEKQVKEIIMKEVKGDDDGWMSFNVRDVNLVLKQDLKRGDIWKKLRSWYKQNVENGRSLSAVT